MYYLNSWIFYLLFALPGLLLGLYAQSKVKSAYKKYSGVRTERNIPGAEVARELLDSAGLYDVLIERVPGEMTDHYDPRNKVLRLSEGVHDKPSVAAAGIAAHEAGHALQHAAGYKALGLRTALVPATNFSSKLAPALFGIGFLLNIFIGAEFGLWIAWLGVILFGVAVLFTLITLPVEFDASKRAKQQLVTQNILFPDEMEGVNKVLNAAALTYVAAAVAAIGQLLYYIAILNRRR